MLGIDEVAIARETGEPLFVFDDVGCWIRGSTFGAVIVDWKSARAELNGVSRMRCSRDLAPKLYEATRECWPAPAIEVPEQVRHAA